MRPTCIGLAGVVPVPGRDDDDDVAGDGVAVPSGVQEISHALPLGFLGRIFVKNDRNTYVLVIKPAGDESDAMSLAQCKR